MNARTSEKNSRSSSLRKAPARRMARSWLPPRTPKSARRGLGESAQSLALRSRRGPATGRWLQHLLGRESSLARCIHRALDVKKGLLAYSQDTFLGPVEIRN